MTFILKISKRGVDVCRGWPLLCGSVYYGDDKFRLGERAILASRSGGVACNGAAQGVNIRLPALTAQTNQPPPHRSGRTLEAY